MAHLINYAFIQSYKYIHPFAIIQSATRSSALSLSFNRLLAYRYTEISDKDTTFYRWSNDNDVYTELAHPGFIEAGNTVTVFFAGERDSLDNSKAVRNTVPRNLGCIQMARDFDDDTVYGGSAPEKGGYYTYYGNWKDLINKGMHWLTSHRTTDFNVQNIKTAKIGEDVVVMYEVWSLSEYLHTVLAVVDVKCKVKISKKVPHSALRLIPRDDVFVSADASSLYFYTGDSAGGRVVRTMIALKDGSGKGSSSTSTVGKSCNQRAERFRPVLLLAYMQLLHCVHVDRVAHAVNNTRCVVHNSVIYLSLLHYIPQLLATISISPY